MTIQFTKGNLFSLRTVGLKDLGDRTESSEVVYKAGEPRGVDASKCFTGTVQALAPFKGEWLCRVTEDGPFHGLLLRVHTNKIAGSEAATKYLSSQRTGSDGKGKPLAATAQDPVRAMQACRAAIARLEAELATAKALLPTLAEAAKADLVRKQKEIEEASAFLASELSDGAEAVEADIA